MDFETLRRELLKSMNQISVEMPETILLNYFDKQGNENKYLLSMFLEAFKTMDIFCIAIQKVALSQAGLLLRQLVEQVAICHILVNHQNLIPKFVEHYKFRIETANFGKSQQIDELSKRFGVPNNRNALAYMDYGWIGFENPYDCSEDGMLKYAGFDCVIPWRKKYLDKLAHTSFTSTDLIGETKDFPIINNFVEISAYLFDHLCVSFHNLTEFAFVIDGEDLFNNFRTLYKSYKIKDSN